MAKKKRLKGLLNRSNGNGRLLVRLSSEDLETWKRLHGELADAMQRFHELDKAATAFNRELAERYELPSRFQIELDTGNVYPPIENEEEAVHG